MTYAELKGLSLAYEEHGSAEDADAPPLILLHGGLGSGDMYAPILPALASGRRVITADLQAHGRTADVDRPLRFETMADDIAELIAVLDVGRADVMGYSLGGGVALRTAIQHPGLVRRLVLVSVPCRRTAWFPEVSEGMRQMGPDAAEMMKQSPPYQNYARIAPRVEDWPVLITKTGELISRDLDWSDEAAALAAATLLVYADADSIRPEHMVEFYHLLGGGRRDAGWPGSDLPPRTPSQLAVLPGTTHYDIFMSPLLPTVVNAFLTPA